MSNVNFTTRRSTLVPVLLHGKLLQATKLSGFASVHLLSGTCVKLLLSFSFVYSTQLIFLSLSPLPHSFEQMRTLIKQGNTNRATGATNLNEQSSRSHMLVTLTIRTTNKRSGDIYVGKLSLVDLAGSERLAKSQTTGQA